MAQRLSEVLAVQAPSADVTQPQEIQSVARLGDVVSTEPHRVTEFPERELMIEVPEGIKKEVAAEGIDPGVAFREGLESKGEIGFFEQWRRQDISEMIPFNPEAAVKATGVLLSINRLKGDDADPNKARPDNDPQRIEDFDRVRNFLMTAEEERIRGFSTGGNVARGIAMLPGFAIEFMSTGGAATMAKLGVRKVIQSSMRQIVKSGSLKFAARTSGALAGASARTALMPHRVIGDFAERQITANLELTDDGISIAKKATQTPMISGVSAFGSVLIENFSEVTGTFLNKAGKAVGKNISSRFTNIPLPSALINGLIKVFRKLRPDKNIRGLFTKAGFNGILEEMGEERVGNFLRALTGIESFDADNPHSVMDRVISSIPNSEELLVEGLVFSFPATLQLTASGGIKLIQKRKKDGKVKEPKLNELTDEQIDMILREKGDEEGAEEIIVPEEIKKEVREEERAKAEKAQKKAVTGARKEERDKQLELAENRLLKQQQRQGVIAKKLAETSRNANEFFEGILGVLTTRLAGINPKLKFKLRRFEFDLKRRIQNDENAVVPYMTKYNAMTQTDRDNLDFGLKNGDMVVIDPILDKNDMQGEFKEVREMLDGMYKRVRSVGLDVEYLENFHPRSVKDVEGLLEFFRGTPVWVQLEAAIRKKDNATGSYMSREERVMAINSLLRGVKNPILQLENPNALKDRKIDHITPEIDKFYYEAKDSLLQYIYTVNNFIETSRFFGRVRESSEVEPTRLEEEATGALQAESKGLQAKDFGEFKLEDSIGALVADLTASGDISFEQAKEVSEIFRARFTQRGTTGIITTLKNISYIDILGSPINAITQTGDMALAGYKSGSLNVLRSFFETERLTKEDIGVGEISIEFSGGSASHKAVKAVFNANGFTFMDTLGKEALINSSYLKYKDAVVSKEAETRRDFLPIFGEETDSVIEDLKNDRVSENVRFLLFSDLSDMQPISLSEMPEKYNTGGNGRIFYMLKSFTIRTLNTVREDVFQKMKTNPKQAMKNLMGLSVALTLSGAGPDLVKDFILGRPINPTDILVDNILKIVGFSKFLGGQVLKSGVTRAAEEIVFPPLRVLDSVFKDGYNAVMKGAIYPQQWESVRSIPVGGELYYWWFGKGVEKKSKGKKRSLSKPI